MQGEDCATWLNSLFVTTLANVLLLIDCAWLDEFTEQCWFNVIHTFSESPPAFWLKCFMFDKHTTSWSYFNISWCSCDGGAIQELWNTASCHWYLQGCVPPNCFISGSSHFKATATPLYMLHSVLAFILNHTAGFIQVSIFTKTWKKKCTAIKLMQLCIRHLNKVYQVIS